VQFSLVWFSGVQVFLDRASLKRAIQAFDLKTFGGEAIVYPPPLLPPPFVDLGLGTSNGRGKGAELAVGVANAYLCVRVGCICVLCVHIECVCVLLCTAVCVYIGYMYCVYVSGVYVYCYPQQCAFTYTQYIYPIYMLTAVHNSTRIHPILTHSTYISITYADCCA
jgi:hypothetical protein